MQAGRSVLWLATAGALACAGVATIHARSHVRRHRTVPAAVQRNALPDDDAITAIDPDGDDAVRHAIARGPLGVRPEVRTHRAPSAARTVSPLTARTPVRRWKLPPPGRDDVPPH